MSAPRLSMYIPKDGYKHERPRERWSVSMPWDGSDYISYMEIQEHYDFVGEYDHKCECGGDVEPLPNNHFSENEIACPKCNTQMDCYWVEPWD